MNRKKDHATESAVELDRHSRCANRPRGPPGCAANGWKHDTANGVRYNTTFSRQYKDRDDGQWKSTDSFGRDDLLVLAKVADATHTWICAQAQEK